MVESSSDDESDFRKFIAQKKSNWLSSSTKKVTKTCRKTNKAKLHEHQIQLHNQPRIPAFFDHINKNQNNQEVDSTNDSEVKDGKNQEKYETVKRDSETFYGPVARLEAYLTSVKRSATNNDLNFENAKSK